MISYKDQVDRFSIEIADEFKKRKTDANYKPILEVSEIAQSLATIYSVDYRAAMSDLMKGINK